MKRLTAKDCYPEIYAMTPMFEKEPGWWKLKWKPIWRETISAYVRRSYSHRGRWWHTVGFGISYRLDGAHNGWGRSYDSFSVDVRFLHWTFSAWIKWNYIVMAEGPSDGGEMVPLTLPSANDAGVNGE